MGCHHPGYQIDNEEIPGAPPEAEPLDSGSYDSFYDGSSRGSERERMAKKRKYDPNDNNDELRENKGDGGSSLGQQGDDGQLARTQSPAPTKDTRAYVKFFILGNIMGDFSLPYQYAVSGSRIDSQPRSRGK